MYKIYCLCLLIRKTEEAIEKLFSEGKLFGTTHCCIGQEIIPVSILPHLLPDDTVTSTHRSHGHFLSLFPDPKLLLLELMGKKDSINQGKCGSQHLHYKNFYTNGITGGMIPVGTGIALSNKLNNSNIVVSFLGDGALNEGYVLEAFNFACVNKLPILYVVENNQYAMSTRSEDYTSKNIIDRINSFDMELYNTMPHNEWSCLDRIKELEGIKDMIDYVRNYKLPAIIVFNTFRLCGHSKSDKCEYMNIKEIEKNRSNDYLLKIRNSLIDIDQNKIFEIENDIENIISEALKICNDTEFSNPLEVYANEVW